MCRYDFILLHNEVSALSWLKKIFSHFFHASWCWWKLQGWAHTMITLPDLSHHLHVCQLLDQGRRESVTQRKPGAGKGTQVPSVELDQATQRCKLELTLTRDLWEHYRQIITDRTSTFLLLKWTPLSKSAEIISHQAIYFHSNMHSIVHMANDLRKVHQPTKKW